MKDYEKYIHHDVDDLVSDEDFYQWVKHPTEESDAFWHTFLLLYPHKEKEIKDARQFILGFGWEDRFSQAEKRDLWGNIREQLGREAKVIQFKAKKRHLLRSLVAASIAGVLMLAVSWIYFQQRGRIIAIHSAFGEKKVVSLPDGTEVVLNGNSELQYARNLLSKETREVWIHGEGYFKVNHLNKDPRNIKAGERFIVHTPDVNVEVLGTEFNVNTHSGNSSVSLNSGSIRLSFADRSDTLTMKPGDLVSYSGMKKDYVKKVINPYERSSWIDNKIVLHNTPMPELVDWLNNIYGLNIVLSDTSLVHENLSGEIPAANEAEMLLALSKTLDLHVDRTGTEIFLTRNSKH